ncbi:spermidine/putrescine ABC transporter substrate-binding protein [Actinocorallia sp. A-T 12471]|uniref:ABC transporter substrate-binding protein n=1 Tax=Actinocorallia sp. A-T 12471 TaxID=3089813 RepID=UPI0029CB574C|nr:spermidine/putrescine ABC transporter substrate-binding protein [Actinocorallia sp. A-T 12471]MDX6742301.1 spermidine/putrescine ABC transporter substrate-binding protein [Actinocorallia sp. A-T 12471]
MRRPSLRKLGSVAGVLAMTAVVAACGGGDGDGKAGSADSATVSFLNYPGWIGETEIADFQKANSGITVKETAIAEGGSAALASQLAQNKGTYDLVLAGNVTAKRLDQGKLLAKFDPASVPNLAKIPQEYRDAYPWGVPTNTGKVGIAYNKELVTDPPKSWKELFDRADEFKGKIVFPDYDRDVISIALLALGYDLNSTDAGQLAEAEKLILAIKPKLLAFASSDQDKPLLSGSAAIAVLYDYTYAGAGSDKIAWVSPTEGTPGYIEGVVPVAGGKHGDAAAKFLDFHLDPVNYAGFINTTGASFLMKEAESGIDEKILDNVALKPSDTSPFLAEQFLDPKTEEARNAMWQRIKAS